MKAGTKILVLSGLIWMVWVPGVWSQNETPLKNLTLDELLNVTVFSPSKVHQRSFDAPATVYVVTADTITRRGYRDLADLLVDIPEIEINAKSDGETWNNYTVRGISGNERLIIQIDGVRVSSPTGDHHVIGTNFPIVNAERVEVVIGPASALYGVDAFSTVVNIITKSGKDINGGRLNFEEGRFTTTDSSATLGSRWRGIDWTLSGRVYRSGEPFLPKYYPDEYAWYTDRYVTQGQVLRTPFSSADDVVTIPIRPYATPTDSYGVYGHVLIKNFEIGYFRSYESHNTSISVRPEFTVYEKDARWQTTLETLFVRHTYISPKKHWHLQSTMSRSLHEIGNHSLFVNAFSNYQNAYKYGYGRNTKLEEQLTWFSSSRLTVMGGASYEDLTALAKTSDLPFPFDPNLPADFQGLYYLGTDVTDVNGRSLKIQQDTFDLQYRNVGVYAQIQWGVKEHYQVTVGGRYDYNTRYGGVFNPRLSLVVHPSQRMKLKLLYGEAYASPSPYKAYEHFGSFEPVRDDQGGITGLKSTFWHLPNPDLKPERLKAFEGEFYTYFSDHFGVGIDGYYNRLRDRILDVTTDGGWFKGIPIDHIQTPINLGASNAWGGSFRMDGIWHWGNLCFTAYGVYTYSDGNLDGDILPYMARHTVKVGLDLEWGPLVLAPRMIYRSRSFHIRKDESGRPISNDPFVVINVHLAYRDLVQSKALRTSIFLDITNLTDRRYFHVREGGGRSELLRTPQDPLRYTMGLNVRF